MGQESNIQRLKGEKLASFLQSSPFDRGVHAIQISHRENGRGELFLRDNIITAAKCGRLYGNGAVMVMAGWCDVTLTEVPAPEDVRKNVTLKTENLEDLLAQYGTVKPFSVREDAAYKDAILSIYSLQYKQAGAKLTEILRSNKYDYMAWLWYSRLLSKVDSIQAALNEAHKWGSHDQEIWQEMRKSQSLDLNGDAKVKRCLFCWTPLAIEKNSCSNCHSLQRVGKGNISEDLDDVEVKRVLHRFYKTFQSDQSNAQLAYVLSVGMFNLEQLQRSFQFLQLAVKSAPQTKLYQSSLSFLRELCVAKGLIKKRASAEGEKGQDELVKKTVPRVKLSPDKKTILVVEDSQTSRKVIGMVLKREGLQTLEATNGEEALELAKSYKPDLVLLDVMLPDTTGHEVLPKMRENKHMEGVPVIMLTGRRGTEDRMKGMMAGSNEYLTKPFDPKKLTSVIKRYL